MTKKTRFHVLISDDAKTALVGFSHIEADEAGNGDIAGVDVSAAELDALADGMKAKAAEMRATQGELAKAAAVKRLFQ